MVGILEDLAINHAEARIEKQLGRREGVEVPRRGEVHPMIVRAGFEVIGKAAGNRRGPRDYELLRVVVVEQVVVPWEVDPRAIGFLMGVLVLREAVEDLAHSENRPVRDGEVQPACAQACPAYAITFGRIDDPNTQVSQLAGDSRNYKMLDELGTLPRITYLKGGASHGGSG